MLGVQTTILRGARRVVMNSKMGNKNYYKGRRCNPTGFITKKGRFVVDPFRLVQYVVPDMTDFSLKPYVTVATDKPTSTAQPVTVDDLMKGAHSADAIIALQRREEREAAANTKANVTGKAPSDDIDSQVEPGSTAPSGFFSNLFGGSKKP